MAESYFKKLKLTPFKNRHTVPSCHFFKQLHTNIKLKPGCFKNRRTEHIDRQIQKINICCTQGWAWTMSQIKIHDKPGPFVKSCFRLLLPKPPTNHEPAQWFMPLQPSPQCSRIGLGKHQYASSTHFQLARTTKWFAKPKKSLCWFMFHVTRQTTIFYFWIRAHL